MIDVKIEITNGRYLSSIQRDDKEALIEHLKAKEIYERTALIPYPYSEADADWWINTRLEARKNLEREVVFGIRNPDGHLIGAIGAQLEEIGLHHRAEFGYWLAKPYWGQGITTDAVRVFIRYAFSELKLSKLTADVFAFNTASARVLEKNGFQKEGYLRQHYFKDGKFIDAIAYGLLKQDLRS
ncbi:MAG TPA: GNAT family protein [Blastocatellia bacterium]|nr:GNAT family protein [Blastocatellia bacterium]